MGEIMKYVAWCLIVVFVTFTVLALNEQIRGCRTGEIIVEELFTDSDGYTMKRFYYNGKFHYYHVKKTENCESL